MKYIFILSFVIVLRTFGAHAQLPLYLRADSTHILSTEVKASNLRVSNYNWNKKPILVAYTGTIRIENIGSDPITIRKADWGQGSDLFAFNVDDDLDIFENRTIQPGEVISLSTSFHPVTSGPKSATIQFITNISEVIESQLDGIGIVGRLSTSDLDFGLVGVKSQVYSKKRFMISCNEWDYADSVTITDIKVVSGTVGESLTGPFSNDGFRYNKAQIQFPITLQPGQVLVFLDSVEFQVQLPGYYAASLRTKSDAEQEVTSVWIGRGTTSSVSDELLQMSECSFTFSPNPINHDGGSIQYTLPTRSPADITIYSVVGEKVVTLVNSTTDSGSHQVSIPVERLSTGVYVVRMVVGDCALEKSLVIVK